jgi:mRNA interferase RelE/StbE
MWQVVVHRLVLEEDFTRLDRAAQRQIATAIRTKLTTSPTTFSKPLGGFLKGFWRLRVGPYRVLYRLERERLVVLVIKAGMRRDEQVYLEALTRLRQLGML